MKVGIIRSFLVIILHHSIFALVLSGAGALISYVEYKIAYQMGATVFRNPLWALRFFALFIGFNIFINTLFFLKLRRNKMSLSDYSLHLKFEKDVTNKDNLIQLLRRQIFSFEINNENYIVAKRIVGRTLKREQVLAIKLDDGRAYFEVELKNTVYPIDYFLNNYHVKISFLNNPT